MIHGPWRLTLDTNPGLCNHRCIMCEEHSIYSKVRPRVDRIMSKTIMKSAIRLFTPLGLKELIPSTMGEPLLYPFIDDLLEEVEVNGLRLNLTTNGSFPNRAISEWTEILFPLSSDIKVSINGSNKELSESIMVGSDFNRQIQGIKELVKMRDDTPHSTTSITMQITFMEKNLKDIPSFIKLASILGVDRVKGHHLWVTNDFLKGEDLRRNTLSKQEWNDTIRKVNDVLAEMTSKGLRVPKLQNFNPIVEDEQISRGICPFIGKELWVAWDGRINICCAPDELRCSFGDFGNISDGINVFSTLQYNRLKDNYHRSKVCAMCNMKVEEVE